MRLIHLETVELKSVVTIFGFVFLSTGGYFFNKGPETRLVKIILYTWFQEYGSLYMTSNDPVSGFMKP